MPRSSPPNLAHAAELKNVAVKYGSASYALRDVSITLPQGSFHFLTGPSGAGKTSLLKLLYLTLRPTRGSISLFGQDMTNPDRRQLPKLRRRIGIVFQDFRLINHLSVFDNIALPLRIAGRRRDSYVDNVNELIRWVGLANRSDCAPDELSGGEQQRIAIARAVVTSPDLLLADEPTGNVDPDMGARLINLLLQLNQQGAAVLVATHDPELVHAVDAPVLEIEDGVLTRRRRD